MIDNNTPIITAKQMENLIYTIRGQKVMLDFDLARIYGYETKNFNRQVKNNIDKFPTDFMFQLTKEESLRCKNFTLNENSSVENDANLRCKNFTSSDELSIETNTNLRCQNVTSSETSSGESIKNLISQNSISRWGGTRYLPYAFTEQGIYMLMTVLKGELAVKQSKALIRLFKEMKDYISSSTLISSEDFLKLSIQTNENTSAIARIESEMLKKSDLPIIMKAFTKEKANEYLFKNGEICEAYSTYEEIYNKAKKSIFVIDNYISLNTLLMLKQVNSNVDIIIFSDNKNNCLRLKEYEKFEKEYPNVNIEFKQNNNMFHDRYIVLDYSTRNKQIYHCGASSKDAGKKITTITKISDTKPYTELIKGILNNELLKLK